MQQPTEHPFLYSIYICYSATAHLGHSHWNLAEQNVLAPEDLYLPGWAGVFVMQEIPFGIFWRLGKIIIVSH